MGVEEVKNGVKSASLVRQEFGATEVRALSGELQGNAVAASAAAAVQARYIMALQRPRNMVEVRQKLIAEVSDPEFAQDKSAIYHKPVGGGIEGLGIRFAEAASRCLTNVLIESPTVYEDDIRRQIRVTITDLENNVTSMKDIVVNKTIERLAVTKDDVVISFRTNSEGKTTYTIPASESAMYNKENAEVSKAVRNAILRLVPVGLQNECKAIIYNIREGKVKEDPKAAEKAVVDGFSKQNVTVAMLESYLGHPVAQCTPAETVNLQALWSALQSGETTWAEIMADVDEYRKLQRKSKTEEKKTETKGVAATRAAVQEKEVVKKAEPKPEKKVEPAPKEVCAGCGATDVALSDSEAGLLCDSCNPKSAPEPVAEVKAVVAAPVVEKPTAKTVSAKEPPPWARAKTVEAPAAVVETKPAATTLSLEEEVKQMAAEKEQARPRVKPKNATINKIGMPEFVDISGVDESATDDEKIVMAGLMEQVLTLGNTDMKGKTPMQWLDDTVIAWVGLPLAEINSATASALTKVLEFRVERAAKQ